MGFLTGEQRQRYGNYESEPTPIQLARYFHLDDIDKKCILIRRGNHHRLGFALQLVSVRFLGTFLENPLDVPPGVVTEIATQLGIFDIECLPRYLERPLTRWEHQGEIKQRYGYQDFSKQPEHWRLVRWLYGRAWVGSESPSVLFDLATARLVEHKILLPGVTVLERLVMSVRERAANLLWRMLSKLPSAEQRLKLEALLVSEAENWYTPLDQLRKSPTRHSSPALIAALNRLVTIRALGINALNFSRIPTSSLKALARHAATIRVQAIARMPEQRRIATLLAFIRVLEAEAGDDVLDLLELLVKDLLTSSVRDGKKERLRTIKDLDAAALRLSEAAAVILDPNCDSKNVRKVIFERIPQEQLQSAMAKVEEIARPPEDDYYPELLKRWVQVRRFLPSLLRTMEFQATKAGQPILTAVKFLKSIEKKANPKMDAAPLNGISKGWLKLIVQENTEIDRRAYTFCTLERLCDGLRRRELFISPSLRWSNPHAKLLQGLQWESARPQVCRSLNLQPTPTAELEKLKQQLDDAFHRTADNLPSNTAIKIARQKVNVSLIENHWDDMLRVAGSLKLGMVSATDIMRTLSPGDKPSVLGRAIGELGRIAKTLYLLNYVDDEAYRRRILTQLNRGEGRHALARVTFHGQKGELRQRYREGQEDQLSALGLVVNASILWNTYYMDAALTSLRQEQSVIQEDLARLSPLGHAHINMLGRYQFSLPLAVIEGKMRPLRDPNDSNDLDD